ncbi:hypothetical protein MKX03_026747 [Papaver bracteatum]|nr:hypothetical protein MKX03_026747 [Papaver bracteatum]
MTSRQVEDDVRDHRSHEEMMLFSRIFESQKVMLSSVLVESQEMMFGKLVESQDKMFVKLVESQDKMFNKLVESQDMMFGKLESILCKLDESQVNSVSNNHKTQEEENPSSDCYKHQDLEGVIKSDIDDKLAEIIIKKSSSGDNNADDAPREDIIEVPYPDDEQVQQQTRPESGKNPYLDGYGRLYRITLAGDWEEARDYFKDNPEAIAEVITHDLETVLHLAMNNDDNQMFVEELVELMPPEALACKTKKGFTALHYAAIRGNTEIVKALVKKNANLTQISEDQGIVPLGYALTARHEETSKYLYSVTRDEEPSPFFEEAGARLLCQAINSNFLDLARSLAKRFPQVITWKNDLLDISGLELIIQRPFVFHSGANLTWWQRYIYSLIQVDIDSTYNALHQAYEVKESLLLSTLRYLRGEDTDEENPSIFVRAEAIKESKQKDSLKVSSTSAKGIITRMFFSVNSFWRRMQDVFFSIDLMSYLTQVPPVKELYNQKLMHKQASALVKQMLSQLKRTMDRDQLRAYFDNDTNVMQTAMKHGTVEFVAECLKKFPFMLWSGFNGQKMIPMAIIERNEIILTLLCEANMNTYTPMKNQLLSYRDEKGNTILHHAAKLASSFQLNLISGLALQMLREIQWFKGVESIIPEEDKFRRNRSGDTAQYVFTEEHKDLLEKAEKWMKDTSGSCMVVAALIATVAFAAVFTVPGGNISDSNSSKNGTPVFLGKPLFTIFSVADALALFSSITSVLMFLAIYTSRYAEEDFLKSLPQKLIIGLATLFISMATIVIAFGVTLFMVLRDRFPWSIIPIVLFSCVPVTLFAWLQLPLFVEMVQSTYWGGSLFQKYRYVKPIKKSDQKKKEN